MRAAHAAEAGGEGNRAGEGAAVALNDDISARLNAIYGADVSGAQKALLAIRITSAITGAAGTAKAATQTTEAAAKAILKNLSFQCSVQFVGLIRFVKLMKQFAAALEG